MPRAESMGGAVWDVRCRVHRWGGAVWDARCRVHGWGGAVGDESQSTDANTYLSSRFLQAKFPQGAQELWKKHLLNLAPSQPKWEPGLQKELLPTCFLFCYTVPGKTDIHFVNVTVGFRIFFSHHLKKTNLAGCDGTCL